MMAWTPAWVSGRRQTASGEGVGQLRAGRGPADDRALGADHGERRLLEFGKVALGRGLDQQAIVAAVVCFAHRGLHAHFGRDSGDEEVGDAFQPQDVAQVGCIESPLARLVDDDLARLGRQRGDDLHARFAPPQDPAHGTRVADAKRRISAQAFCRRAIGKVATMGFPRVDHGHPRGPTQIEEASRGGDDRLQEANVVAERRADPARLDEVALHVDHDERGGAGLEAIREGLRGDRDHACPAIAGPITAMSAFEAGVSCTIRPSNIRTMRSESSSSSSRSALTSSTAAPSLRAARMRSWISATAAKSRPNTGLAAISTNASPESSRASTARCTLPPESAAIGVSGPRVLTLNSRIQRSACLRMAPLRSHTPAASGARSKFRSAMFSATLIFGTHAFLSGSSGRLNALKWRDCPRDSDNGLPPMRTSPATWRRCPTSASTNSIWPFPETPAIPTISPGCTSRAKRRTAGRPASSCTSRAPMARRACGSVSGLAGLC